MVTQQDRARLLDEALAKVVPESPRWVRGTSAVIPGASFKPQCWIEITSPVQPESQRLVALLRHDGDIQVEYHIATKSGSPFEVLFPLPENQEAEVIEQVSLFVADLLAERLVLAYRKSLFNGGRCFLDPKSITESGHKGYRWIVSWLGTYDWQP